VSGNGIKSVTSPDLLLGGAVDKNYPGLQQ
jgi:hypothetical protein